MYTLFVQKPFDFGQNCTYLLLTLLNNKTVHTHEYSKLKMMHQFTECFTKEIND